MFKIAIIEDDENYAKLLEQHINTFAQSSDTRFRVSVFQSGISFFYKTSELFNIIFLDIEMPTLNGIETAKKIRETDSNVTIIFVTNMAKYAISGYEVDAMDFMVKPIDYFNFKVKFEKAINIQSKKKQFEYTRNKQRRVNQN